MKKLGSVLCVLCFVSPFGFARGKKDSWENLNRLRAGEQIEVVDLEGPQWGTFLSFSADQIVLRVDGAEVPIQRANVLQVVSRRSRRLRHIALGVAIGVGAGIAISVPFLLALEQTGVVEVLVGPLIGAGAGAGIGALVPAGSRTIYRVKKSSRNAP